MYVEFVAPAIIPYVGWIPTRIGVLVFQDILVNGVALWDAHLWLQFLWLILEGFGLFFIGTRVYRKFVKN